MNSSSPRITCRSTRSFRRIRIVKVVMINIYIYVNIKPLPHAYFPILSPLLISVIAIGSVSMELYPAHGTRNDAINWSRPIPPQLPFVYSTVCGLNKVSWNEGY